MICLQVQVVRNNKASPMKHYQITWKIGKCCCSVCRLKYIAYASPTDIHNLKDVQTHTPCFPYRLSGCIRTCWSRDDEVLYPDGIFRQGMTMDCYQISDVTVMELTMMDISFLEWYRFMGFWSSPDCENI